MAMNFLIHPLIIFFASNTAFTITAAYTSRYSPLRYVALTFLAVCAYVFPSCLVSFARTTGWVGRVPAGAVFWNIISCFERLILRKWDYNHYGPSTQNNQDKQRASREQATDGDALRYSATRMDFGSEVTGTARGIGLFWEVKNVPYFDEMKPGFVPSRGTFLFMQSIAVFSCYYLHDMTVKAVLGLDPQYLRAARVPLLTRLSEVSVEELKARIISSVGYWVIQYSLIQFFYSAAGIVSALSNPENIKLWRPLFGSPSHAYTIRNFWGKAWHQNLRSGVEGPSEFFARDILQLPDKGVLQRYTKIICSFIVSGMMHHIADTGGGLSISESGATQFFCMQALGIIIEDCMQTIYRRYFKHISGSNARFVESFVGYAWVFFFLVWTTPVWVFPATLNMRMEDDLLSLDAVKPILFCR